MRRLPFFVLILAAIGGSDLRAQQPGMQLPDSMQVFLTGRLFADAAFYRESIKGLSNGTELRRIRLGALGFLDARWAFEVEADFSDDDLDVKDAWLTYNWPGRTSVQVGNFKEPMGLEELTSSRFITFLERSQASVFTPGRQIGAAARYAGSRVNLTAGLFGQNVGDEGADDLQDDEGYAITGRATFTPVLEPGRVLHVGVSGTRRTPDAREGGGDRVRFRTRSETHVDRTRFLNTGRIGDTDHWTVVGLEVAAQVGSTSAQAEYLRTDVSRNAGAVDATFSGAYAQISWMVTGEARPYVPEVAEFGPFAPSSRRGALELAARVSTLDLNDADAGVEGGAATQWTAGASWYPTARVRLMANYSWVDHDPLADGNGNWAGNDDFSFLQVRVQMHF